MITISIVSHGQRALVADLLADLAGYPQVSSVILTHNIPEEEVVIPLELIGRLTILFNTHAKGFGANHNAAFQLSQTPFFCVMNPDVRIKQNPFPALVNAFSVAGVALCTPVVLDPAGKVEDNVRNFPQPFGLLMKAFGLSDGRLLYASGKEPFQSDWVAGMFMLFRVESFRDVGGFDERFFLYYEDVDICVRLWKTGWKVMVHPEISIIHAAQRASRKKPKYMMWHLLSMVRYFAKHMGRLPCIGHEG